MKIAVVGGKLQGVEACYLAQKAGFDVLLIDKKDKVPAQGLCDSFYCVDVVDTEKVSQILKDVQLILPALENITALKALKKLAKDCDIPISFDLEAFLVSYSKIKSDKLFKKLGIPAPIPWPECDFPLIVKPSEASGSTDVYFIENSSQFTHLKRENNFDSGWVIQEYLEGPSYSLEIIGINGIYKPLQITELFMDDIYDCKRVTAPVSLEPSLKRDFEELTIKIAKALDLNGIMDIEVILHDNKLKVLEIDARLPSQTPTAVFKSTGINIVEKLKEMFTGELKWYNFSTLNKKGVVYEHIKVSPKEIKVCGEHIMAEAEKLFLVNDFFGADEAITDYSQGKETWVATLIITGENLLEAQEKRDKVIKNIQKKFEIKEILDPNPSYKNIF